MNKKVGLRSVRLHSGVHCTKNTILIKTATKSLIPLLPLKPATQILVFLWVAVTHMNQHKMEQLQWEILREFQFRTT